MLELKVYISAYVRGDDLVIELEDEDGWFISGTSISLVDLKTALDALDTQSQSKENL